MSPFVVHKFALRGDVACLGTECLRFGGYETQIEPIVSGGKREDDNRKSGDEIEKCFQRIATKLPMRRNGRTYLLLSLTEGSPHPPDDQECFLDIGGLGAESRVHALVENAECGHLTRRRTKACCFPPRELATGRIECMGRGTDACCGVFQPSGRPFWAPSSWALRQPPFSSRAFS